MTFAGFVVFAHRRYWRQMRIYRGDNAAPSMRWQANVGPLSIWRRK